LRGDAVGDVEGACRAIATWPSPAAPVAVSTRFSGRADHVGIAPASRLLAGDEARSADTAG
jgi:hypothetical protein